MGDLPGKNAEEGSVKMTPHERKRKADLEMRIRALSERAWAQSDGPTPEPRGTPQSVESIEAIAALPDPELKFPAERTPSADYKNVPESKSISQRLASVTLCVQRNFPVGTLFVFMKAIPFEISRFAGQSEADGATVIEFVGSTSLDAKGLEKALRTLEVEVRHCNVAPEAVQVSEAAQELVTPRPRGRPSIPRDQIAIAAGLRLSPDEKAERARAKRILRQDRYRQRKREGAT